MKITKYSFKQRINVLKNYKKKLYKLNPDRPVLKTLYKTKDLEKRKEIEKKEKQKKIKCDKDLAFQGLILFLFIKPYNLLSYINGKCNSEEWKKEWGKPNIEKLSIRKLKKILKKEKWDKLELQIYTCDWVHGWWATAVEIEK